MKSLGSKLIFKATLFVLVTSFVYLVAYSTSFNNQIAMGQMENSDAAYFAMQYFNNVRPIVKTVYGWFCFAMTVSVSYDIYKFVKE